MGATVVVSSRAAAVLTTGPIALVVGCADGQIAPWGGVLPRISHPELRPANPGCRGRRLAAACGGDAQQRPGRRRSSLTLIWRQPSEPFAHRRVHHVGGYMALLTTGSSSFVHTPVSVFDGALSCPRP